jgi:HK97 family phage major capsid protein
MKDSTLAFVRKIKTGLSGDKTTLWQPSVQAGVPDSLLGKPVYTDPNMAALGASSKVVLFGDYSEYWIRDVGAPTVKVLNERYADTGQIGVRVSQRTDGELADTAAVKALSTSAT